MENQDTTYPKVVFIEAVVMANGEVIHYGKTLGFINEKQRRLLETKKSAACKLAKGGEPVIALGDMTA